MTLLSAKRAAGGGLPPLSARTNSGDETPGSDGFFMFVFSIVSAM